MTSSVKEKICRVVEVFLGGDLLEDPDDLSDCELKTGTDVSAVLVVIDVLVSPSSVVTECCEDVSLVSDWEFVEPQAVLWRSTNIQDSFNILY